MCSVSFTSTIGQGKKTDFSSPYLPQRAHKCLDTWLNLGLVCLTVYEPQKLLDQFFRMNEHTYFACILSWKTGCVLRLENPGVKMQASIGAWHAWHWDEAFLSWWKRRKREDLSAIVCFGHILQMLIPCLLGGINDLTQTTTETICQKCRDASARNLFCLLLHASAWWGWFLESVDANKQFPTPETKFTNQVLSPKGGNGIRKVQNNCFANLAICRILVETSPQDSLRKHPILEKILDCFSGHSATVVSDLGRDGAASPWMSGRKLAPADQFVVTFLNWNSGTSSESAKQQNQSWVFMLSFGHHWTSTFWDCDPLFITENLRVKAVSWEIFWTRVKTLHASCLCTSVHKLRKSEICSFWATERTHGEKLETTPKVWTPCGFSPHFCQHNSRLFPQIFIFREIKIQKMPNHTNLSPTSSYNCTELHRKNLENTKHKRHAQSQSGKIPQISAVTWPSGKQIAEVI